MYSKLLLYDIENQSQLTTPYQNINPFFNRQTSTCTHKYIVDTVFQLALHVLQKSWSFVDKDGTLYTPEPL